ncbi:hypothetical protein QQ045_015533 [Rhodiola kirilowii]
MDQKLGKKVLILTIFMLVFTWDVEGGRVLQEVVEPQTFSGAGGGGFGSSFPGPTAGGFGFSSSGSALCSWPRLGCFRIPPLFRGPSVPIKAGNTPVTAPP